MEKRPRGRPEVSPEERKDEHIIFRVTAEEREAIEKAAAAAEKKVSDWMRAQIAAAARRQIRRTEG